MTISLKQKLFNKAWRKVIAQGHACVDDTGTCVYTSENGDHCAAGHLVDKKHLHLLREEFPWTEQCKEVRDLVGEPEFVSQLQNCHDDASIHPSYIEKFIQHMRLLSYVEGLTIPKGYDIPK